LRHDGEVIRIDQSEHTVLVETHARDGLVLAHRGIEGIRCGVPGSESHAVVKAVAVADRLLPEIYLRDHGACFKVNRRQPLIEAHVADDPVLPIRRLDHVLG
jgi:hypothetical protein